MYLKKGGDAALFEDVGPWAPSDNQRSSAQVLGHFLKREWFERESPQDVSTSRSSR